MSATKLQWVDGNALAGCGHSPSAPEVQPGPFPPLAGCSHVSLQAPACPVSPPTPETLSVTVFDGCSGSKVHLNLSGHHTAADLRARYLSQRSGPGSGGALNLAYNGKAVPEGVTLKQLGVRTDAMFITYQKCQGG